MFFSKYIQILAILFLFLFTSCTGKVPLISTGVSGPEGLPAEEAFFAKFNDLPMSASSKMNVEKSLIFGGESDWFGRINLTVDLSAAETFDFYRYEMPNFGWEQITSIRSDVSILTYTRVGRVANIRITPSRVRGAEVWITVSPRNNSGNSIDK